MGTAVRDSPFMARELPIDVGASAAGAKLRRELGFGRIFKGRKDF